MNLYSDVDVSDYLVSVQKALIKKKGIQKFPTNSEIEIALAEKDVYNIQAKNRMYFFELLENYNNREHVDINSPNITIEHIFPQNPKLSNFIVGDDKEWVIRRLKNRENDSTNYHDIIAAIETDQEINTDNISFIFDEIDEQNLNSLGNMALLSGKVNTALSNGFFNTKRKILIRKVNSGSFVPKHTLDVFSKMLETEDKNGFEESLVTWSANDISAHRNWIIGRVDKIVSQLKAEKTNQGAIA